MVQLLALKVLVELLENFAIRILRFNIASFCYRLSVARLNDLSILSKFLELLRNISTVRLSIKNSAIRLTTDSVWFVAWERKSLILKFKLLTNIFTLWATVNAR